MALPSPRYGRNVFRDLRVPVGRMPSTPTSVVARRDDIDFRRVPAPALDRLSILTLTVGARLIIRRVRTTKTYGNEKFPARRRRKVRPRRTATVRALRVFEGREKQIFLPPRTLDFSSRFPRAIVRTNARHTERPLRAHRRSADDSRDPTGHRFCLPAKKPSPPPFRFGLPRNQSRTFGALFLERPLLKIT